MNQRGVVLNEILEALQGLISLFLSDYFIFGSFVKLDFLEDLVVGKLQVPERLVVVKDIS